MMEDDFSAFKKSIDHPRSFPVDEERWAALQARLDRSGRRSGPVPIAFWWAVAAALPFVLLSILLWSSLQDSRRINERFLVQLDSLLLRQPNQQATIVQHRIDTIYLERIVYRDQVSDNTLVSAWGDPSSYPKLGYGTVLSSRTLSGLANRYGRLSDYQPLSAALHAYRRDNRTDTYTPPSPANDTKLTFLSPLANLPTLTGGVSTTDKPALAVSPMPTPQFSRRPFQPWRAFNVQELAIEGGIGIGDLLDDRLRESQTLQGVIGLRLPFGKRWEVVGELAAQRLQYVLSEFNAELGAPLLEAPAAGYSFSDAKVRFTSLEYRFGLRYRLATTSRWTPYVGLMYGRQRLLDTHVFYDFLAGEDELTVERDDVDLPSTAATLQPQVGAWYAWPRSRWRLGLSAYYTFPLSENSPVTPGIGLLSRLQFDF